MVRSQRQARMWRSMVLAVARFAEIIKNNVVMIASCGLVVSAVESKAGLQSRGVSSSVVRAM